MGLAVSREFPFSHEMPHIAYNRNLDVDQDVEDLQLPSTVLWDIYSRLCHFYDWFDLFDNMVRSVFFDAIRVEGKPVYRGVNDYVQRPPPSDLRALGLGLLMEGIELGESTPTPDSSALFREAVLRHILVSSTYAEAAQCSGYLHITLGMGERFVNPLLLRDYNCSQGNVVPRVASELCRRAGFLLV
ncbi:hypothetical protein ACOME3_002271 [Neoechinorhynchus agilis]